MIFSYTLFTKMTFFSVSLLIHSKKTLTMTVHKLLVEAVEVNVFVTVNNESFPHGADDYNLNFDDKYCGIFR